MADRKISDLTALTAPAAGDYLPIVDISEASAANKNKRITIEELLRGAPDGTAAAPSIGFESDPNTGIYRPGADQVAISTGGTARLFVDSAGNVGVGTTSPSQALEVAGAAVFTGGVAGQGAYIYRDGGTGGAAYSAQTGDILLTTPGSNNIRFTVNTTERARIDSSGRLLVGTSSSRSVGGSSGVLQIENNNYAALTVTSNTNDLGSPGIKLGKSRGTTNGSNTIVQNGDYLGSITFAGADGTDLETAAASIEAVVDGTPGANDMPGRLVFSTTADGASSPTERLRIQESGDLRIANAATFYPSVDNAISIGVNILRFSAVFAANGTIQTSDEREKTEVAEAILGSDFVKSLRPVSYKWIEGGKRDTGERDESNNYIYESVPGQRTHWGFIAQEVKEAVDAAGVDFGGWVLTDKDDPGSQQALRYDQFIAPLTKALQEAIAKIETLEAKVAALDAQ